MYDPHLAPYIEAFISQHPLLHSLSPPPISPHEERRAVPVSAVSSSSRQPHLTNLRHRRSVRGQDDGDGPEVELETYQPIMRAGERNDYYLDADGLDEWGRSRRATIKVSAKERGIAARAAKRKVNGEHRSDNQNLIDLAHESPADLRAHDRSEKPTDQDCDIRSIIFDSDDTASSSDVRRSNQISSPAANLPKPSPGPARAPTPLDELSRNTHTAESEVATTFPCPPDLSESWSLDIPTMQSTPTNIAIETFSNPFVDPDHPQEMLILSTRPDNDNEDDDLEWISRPHTAHSDYVDAESYTPFGDQGISPSFTAFPSLSSSPLPRIRSPPLVPQLNAGASSHPPVQQLTVEAIQAQETNRVAREMGLSFVRIHNPTAPAGRGGAGSVVASSMSVISSSSESEGGGSEDWEAI